MPPNCSTYTLGRRKWSVRSTLLKLPTASPVYRHWQSNFWHTSLGRLFDIPGGGRQLSSSWTAINFAVAMSVEIVYARISDCCRPADRPDSCSNRPIQPGPGAPGQPAQVSHPPILQFRLLTEAADLGMCTLENCRRLNRSETSCQVT
jgi:hypothetical protein